MWVCVCLWAWMCFWMWVGLEGWRFLWVLEVLGEIINQMFGRLGNHGSKAEFSCMGRRETNWSLNWKGGVVPEDSWHFQEGEWRGRCRFSKGQRPVLRPNMPRVAKPLVVYPWDRTLGRAVLRSVAETSCSQAYHKSRATRVSLFPPPDCNPR